MDIIKAVSPEEDVMYMRMALAEAEIAYEQDEVPIGVVITSHGRVIAHAHNQVEQLQDATAHAEMIAITMAEAFIGSKFLEQCTLYVTIEPCPMCMSALRWARIGRVVYGQADPKGGYMHYSAELAHPKTVITSSVLQEECQALMQSFFRRKRR